MKKIFILLSIMCMTMLTGCVDIDLTLDINKDGSAKTIVEVLGESYMMSQASTDDLEAEYEQVEVITEGTKIGYRITESLDGEVDLDNVTGNEYMNITEEGGLFSKTYTVEARFKDAMFSEMTTEDMSMISMIGASVPFGLHIKSPIEFEETNATSVEEVEGKTVYNWDYTLASMDNLYIKAKVPNVMGIVGAIAVLAIGVIVFIKIRKKKNVKELEEDSY